MQNRWPDINMSFLVVQIRKKKLPTFDLPSSSPLHKGIKVFQNIQGLIKLSLWTLSRNGVFCISCVFKDP